MAMVTKLWLPHPTCVGNYWKVHSVAGSLREPTVMRRSES